MLNYAALVDRNAERWPDRVVVTFEGRRTTNLGFAERVNAAAAALREAGISRGDIVALLLQNCPQFLEVAFAANRLGAIFLPLNFRLAAEEWRYILDHSGSKLLVTETEFLPAIESVRGRIAGLAALWSVGSDAAPGWSLYEKCVAEHAGSSMTVADVRLDDVQRLMYTSGTTSRPKGVPITYGNLLWKNIAHIVEFGITSADRTLVAGPLYHVGGLDLPATGVLYAGGSVVILPRFDPEAVLRTIETEQITNVWLAPAMVNMVLALEAGDRFDTSSVRFVINGGEKMPVPLIERVLARFPKAWFADAYGLTETVSGDTFLDQAHVLSKIGSVGRSVLHLEVRVVDDEGADVGPDGLGEIILRGPKVFHGYWRDPDATAAAIRDGWFHTGDVGRIDEDGYLFIEDRKKDMILSGGENVASPEVERVLYEHPAVLEAAVIGQPDPRWGEVPMAFVALRDGREASAEELIAHCGSQLAKFKVPKRVEFIDALPRNPSGKVLKRVLRETLT